MSVFVDDDWIKGWISFARGLELTRDRETGTVTVTIDRGRPTHLSRDEAVTLKQWLTETETPDDAEMPAQLAARDSLAERVRKWKRRRRISAKSS